MPKLEGEPGTTVLQGHFGPDDMEPFPANGAFPGCGGQSNAGSPLLDWT